LKKIPNISVRVIQPSEKPDIPILTQFTGIILEMWIRAPYLMEAVEKISDHAAVFAFIENRFSAGENSSTVCA